MFTYQYLAKASLGLSLVFALIQPAPSQISANGAGTLVSPQGNQINITGGIQAGANLFHSFQDFNVNSNQVANFLSNPQTQNIFGRINGGNPSMINGLLQVTGGNSNLFLMNPAGIIFGQGASLNLPASFTATTANQIGFGNSQYFSAVGENNFSALTGSPNSFLFTTNGSGSIVNAGDLSVTSGQGISLIGGNVVNTGNLNAGNITLAAVPGTNRVRISQPGHLLSLEITPSADSTIAPLDLPRLLTGQSLPGIRNDGETIEVNGVGIPAGQGVNVTAGNLGTFSQAGTINVLGDRVAILGANLEASGVDGGGTIRVGGEYRGGGNNPFNSRITYVDASSFLRADALNAGDGGRVIVWGDDVTRFYGNIAAKGGANGGNGGFAEVSGAQTLTFAGNADLSAPRGSFGTLLLDPVNILISNGTEDLGTCVLSAFIPTCGPGDITISQTTLQGLSAAADIVLEASNNITFGTLDNNSLDFATCTADPCGNISFDAGGAFNTNGSNINAFGRNLTIEAASITAGNIDTSISTVSRNGGNINLTATGGDIRASNISSGSSLATGNTGSGGSINIRAALGNVNIAENVDSRSVVAGTGNSSTAGTIDITAQSIDAGNIAAYSRVVEGTAGNGGNVTIQATNGSVAASSIISFSRTNDGGNTGIGGDITIDATNDINISGDDTFLDFGLPGDIFPIDSGALAARGGDAGNGGSIRINQNLVSNGNFNVNSRIRSSSQTGFASTAIPNTGIGSSARGGDIFITASNYRVNEIRSDSFGFIGNAGDGGNITINSPNNLSPFGIVSSSSYSRTGNSGNGGTINVNVQNINSGGGRISSNSTSLNGDSGNGGNINVNAQNYITLIGAIDSYSFSRTGNSGNGGNININAQNNLFIVDIQSTSSAANGNSRNGGNITLNTPNSFITSNTIFAESNSGSGNSGNGGNITLNAPNNSITSGLIFAQSSNGIGGRVDIDTGNTLIPISNGFPTFPLDGIDSPTRSSLAIDGTPASISTQGGAGGGAIIITHGGSTSIQFLVGNATNNGTFSAITNGTGANTINNLPVPVPPAINTYGTNIVIRTTTPDTPILPPKPPVRPPEPPVLPPEPPTLPPEPIDTSIFPLLTNPAPPPTPNPVIVGTPPILVVDSIPVAPLPIITTPTPTPSIAPPIVPLPPTVIIEPIEAFTPRLDRPILDANPNIQSPLSLAAANSNIPIIDRIPVDSQNNKIRLLDDPFKEEFQAFTGISDEIATLDVNQAQDILQRIIRETNTKPVFIYVFFAPENEVERNVNSARGLSSPLRVAQDTDILEVVLVPPTGDLVRVKYPGLKRPDVMNTAQRFVSLTANRSNGYIGSARQFHEWIIAPLQEELKKREIDNLVFLMDVGLRSIPLAAMRDKQNGDRFIIEDYSVGLMPSLTLTDTSYTPLRGSEVLGMGAASFVSEDPLPAVPLELNAINQLWGGNTLINENFTLNNLRQARRPGQRIVHLATHGVFAPGEKSNSYIQLWGNERLTLDQIRQAGWGDPPIDLLVLSACETALGDREAELGFAGLAVQAGVKSAMASLWRVSDEGTLGLMTEFYKQLQETTTKSEALRLAQLAMLRGEVRLEGGNLITPQGIFPLNEELRRSGHGDRSFQHPYFWSGFTMVGNPW